MQLVKEKIPALLGHPRAKMADLYVPVTTDGITEFVLWQGEGTPIDFTAVNSKLPPKDLLFPQAEDLYRYQVIGQQITELQEVITEKAQVLFGIRSCDMASIQCMDDVFLTKGYVDSFYQRRREGLLTIAIACAKVLPTCFCDSMGLNPQKATGADIQLLPTAVGYNVIAQTEKGQVTVADWQDFLTDGEAETEQVSCELKVNMAGIPEKLAKMFHHPIWEKEGKNAWVAVLVPTFALPVIVLILMGKHVAIKARSFVVGILVCFQSIPGWREATIRALLKRSGYEIVFYINSAFFSSGMAKISVLGVAVALLIVPSI